MPFQTGHQSILEKRVMIGDRESADVIKDMYNKRYISKEDIFKYIKNRRVFSFTIITYLIENGCLSSVDSQDFINMMVA
jgi:hypothetical protein